MLHSLAHPNIVLCHGVAVMPPAICLVTEWCHHGSLYDLLHTSEYYIRDSCTSRPSHVSRGNRLSLNIRVSNALSGSGGDADSINEITSDGGDPLEDLTPQEDNFHNHGNTSRKSPVTLSPDFDPDLSLGGDLRVFSKRFHPATTRSSLRSLRNNLTSPGTASTESRDSPLKGMGMGEPGKHPFPSTADRSFSFFVEPDLEKQAPNSKPVRSKQKKLKSAASVMQSSRMGYGFGDPNSSPSPVNLS